MQHPKVGVPCCLSACSLMWLTLYAIFIIVEYLRIEAYQPAVCSATTFDVKVRECSSQACVGGTTSSSSQTCTTTVNTCYSCRYYVTAPSREGLPLVGWTDLAGDYTTQAEAGRACARQVQASPFTCYYQPTGNQNIRFLLSLSRPASTTSILPVAGFGAMVLLSAGLACVCACRAACEHRDVELERMYALARQRAQDASLRPARWGELNDQEAWESDIGWLSPDRSPTGPAPRVVVPPGAREAVRAREAARAAYGPGSRGGASSRSIVVDNPLR